MRTSICSAIVIASLSVIPAARAASGPVLWQGKGATFNRNREQTSEYRIEVYRTEVDGTKGLSQAKVYLSNGTLIFNETCETTKTKTGWISDCKVRKGGGYCFGDGLCMDYTEDQNQHGFATTIIMDGPNSMRLLRTELVKGQAVRFFREKLERAGSRPAQP